jgi:hypothetical protein
VPAAGIAIGDMWVAIVGGVGDEWRWVVGGPPMGGAGAAAARALPGEVVLTADAVAAGGLRGRTVEGDPGHIVISEVEPLAAAGDEAPADAETAGEPTVFPRDELLATFLPRELVSRILAGQTGWLAEFRRLTVVFVGVRGFDGDAPGAVTLAQTAFRAAQTLIDRYDGSLNQIIDDDKGLTIVSAWGFPDRTHEDDPARGALAARAMVDALADLGLDVSAGVATGLAFTGVRGGEIRCDYAMLGDVVNLAARLMQSGSGHGSSREVRADAATARVAAPRLDLAGLAAGALGALKLKGKSEGVEAFRIESSRSSGTGGAGASREPSVRTARRQPIGRAAEWRSLPSALSGSARPGLAESSSSKANPVSASPSWWAGWWRAPSRPCGSMGEADAIERSTAYYIWRRPLLESLDIDAADRADHTVVEAAVLARLGGDPALLERASLLDAILPIELPVTPRIAELEADVRADAIRDLAIQLLATALEAAPRLVVLEDVHWADSSSWALLLARRPARPWRHAGPVDATDGGNGASTSSTEPLQNRAACGSRSARSAPTTPRP